MQNVTIIADLGTKSTKITISSEIEVMRDEDGELGSRFGALVQAHRRKAGLTQLELAVKAGLSVAALRDIEQSRRRRPRPSSLVALAEALDLDPERVVGMVRAGRDPEPSQPPRQSSTAPTPGPVETVQELRLAVLGPLEAWSDGRPLSLGPPARRAVLGVLLVDPGLLVRRDAIIDVLWGEEPPRTAVNLVQAHVSRLRKVLEPRKHPVGGDAVIDTVRGAYRMRLSVKELDLLLFKDLAARAAAARADGDDAVACELYGNAARLWRGDPLADVDMLSGYSGITLLRQQLTSVLLRYAELACALGKYHLVLPRLQALAAAEPLNESAHAHLMIALAGTGQQAAAIRVYEDLRSRLDLEMGLYPGEELAEAHLRVLRQDIRTEGHGRAQPRHASSAVLDRDSKETKAAMVAALSLGRSRAPAEPTAVSELISLRARLPRPRLPVAARAALAAETPDEGGWLDALQTGESAISIQMAFSWSQARLSEVARRTFRLLGVHPGPDITVPAAASLGGLTRSQAYAALAELCEEHLVTQYAPGRYECHDLLRAYAAQAARFHYDDGERREAVHRVLDYYLHAANAASAMLYPYHVQFTREQLRPGVLPEQIDDPGQAAEWFRNERQVLLAGIGRAAEEAYAPHAWELPWAAGPFLSGKACWRELTAAQESALVVACKLGDLAGQSLACHHLGLLLTGRVITD
jgi:DNA-binding SARP family transcriptional activator/DNA-binding XRE family transcriptional regulator